MPVASGSNPRSASPSDLAATRSGIWHAALASFIVACLAYWPSARYGFVYDDSFIIEQDARLRAPGFFWKLWTATWWPEGGPAAPASRPITTLTYWLEMQTLGDKPWHFHLINILLFALLAALVAWLTRLWFRSPAAAWIAGLLFAAHPIHVEAAANLVGRAELLAAIFITCGAGLYLKWRKDLSLFRALGLSACMLLAGLSKEHGYILPLIFAAIEIAERRRESLPLLAALRPWRLLLGIAAVAVIAFLQRHALSAAYATASAPKIFEIDNPLVVATPAQRILSPLMLIGKTSQLFVWPVNQSPDYSLRVLMPASSLDQPLVLLGIAVVIAWLVGVIVCWRRRSVILGPLLAIPLTYIIPSNTVLLIGTLFGERLLLTLSVFLAILIGGLAGRTRWPAGVSRWIAIAVSLAAITFAAINSSNWSDYWDKGMLDALLLPAVAALIVTSVIAAAIAIWRGVSPAMCGALAILVMSFGAAAVTYMGVWKNTRTLIYSTNMRFPESGRFEYFVASDIYEQLAGSHLKDADPAAVLDDIERHARLALEMCANWSEPKAVLACVAQRRGDAAAAKRYADPIKDTIEFPNQRAALARDFLKLTGQDAAHPPR